MTKSPLQKICELVILSNNCITPSPTIFYCTLLSNAKSKSNKSELWNGLSYRGLPYHFEVRYKTFRNDCKIWRSQPQKFNLDFHSTSTTSKGLSENSKKMSWDNPVLPIDTENSSSFFVQFFLNQPRLVGDSVAWTIISRYL